MSSKHLQVLAPNGCYIKSLSDVYGLLCVFTIYLLLRSLQSAGVDVTLPSTASWCSDWVFCGIVFHYNHRDDIAILPLAADTLSLLQSLRQYCHWYEHVFHLLCHLFSKKCTRSWLQKTGKRHFQRAVRIVSRIYLPTSQAATSV